MLFKNLEGLRLKGTWKSSSIYDVKLFINVFLNLIKKPYNYFENSEGKIIIKLHYSEKFLDLSTEILDGDYKDQKSVALNFPLSMNIEFPLFLFIDF